MSGVKANLDYQLKPRKRYINLYLGSNIQTKCGKKEKKRILRLVRGANLREGLMPNIDKDKENKFTKFFIEG